MVQLPNPPCCHGKMLTVMMKMMMLMTMTLTLLLNHDVTHRLDNLPCDDRHCLHERDGTWSQGPSRRWWYSRRLKCTGRRLTPDRICMNIDKHGPSFAACRDLKIQTTLLDPWHGFVAITDHLVLVEHVRKEHAEGLRQFSLATRCETRSHTSCSYLKSSFTMMCPWVCDMLITCHPGQILPGFQDK